MYLTKSCQIQFDVQMVLSVECYLAPYGVTYHMIQLRMINIRTKKHNVLLSLNIFERDEQVMIKVLITSPEVLTYSKWSCDFIQQRAV